MRPTSHNHPCGSRERGAVLVTSMLLLLVLTIIGVTVMQMSRMQERMAGNSRDVNLAFQASEAGLRGAEEFIDNLDARPVSCATEACNFRLDGSITGNVGLKDQAWWDDNSHDYGLEAMENLAEPPQTLVEELGSVRTDGDIQAGQGEEDTRWFYQVSSRSTGGSGQAEVVLQSTFTRRY
jgi:type IV pilus assembly protein PilX